MSFLVDARKNGEKRPGVRTRRIPPRPHPVVVTPRDAGRLQIGPTITTSAK
jgi:hypothetical protein